MVLGALRAGTKVRLNYASDTKWIQLPVNKNLGVGTVEGKWSSTSYRVNFPKRGQLVVGRNDLIVVQQPSKRYRHPKSPTYDKVWDFTRRLHGSGIDADWSIEETVSSFRASNSFHVLDEPGFYVGWADFTVIFPKNETMGNFTLQFNGRGAQYLAQKFMLRDYLEDTISGTLSELGLR